MPDMIVRVPYVYTAVIRRPRKRVDETVGYRGEVDVSIPVLGPDEAPVVLHGTPGSHRELAEHRFHDGGLWKPEVEGRDTRAPALPATWLHGDPERDASYHPLFRKSSGYSDYRMGVAVPRDSDTEVKHVVSDEEVNVVAEVRAAAARHVVIDGGVWKRASEPVFDISRHLFGRDHVTLSTYDPSEGGRDQYRLDQAGWIRELDWSKSVRADDDTPGVVLLRPDLLRARTTERSVAWTANNLRTAMFEKMAKGSVDDFAAYVRLRDVATDLDAALKHDRPADLVAMADALREGLDVLARLDGLDGGMGVNHNGMYVDNALGRIERELAAPENDEVARFAP